MMAQSKAVNDADLSEATLSELLVALRDSESRHQQSEDRCRRIFEHAVVSLWEADFSEVKRFLAQLAEQGVRDFRAHFESHPGAVREAARLVRVEDVNAETLKLHGAASREQLLGELEKTLVPESYDFFREALVALNEGHSSFSSEAVVKTLQGKRRDILMTIVFPSEDPRSRALVSTLDITDGKRLEQRLLHSRKMEVVGLLAGRIAHDFNNLLAVILGRSELLLGMLPPDSEMTSQVELIRETGMLASHLTSRLLAYSQRQLPPIVADLNETITDTVSVLQRLMGENVKIRLQLGSDLAPVRMDPGQLEQILVNLALNARDAMPDGGCLSIETENAYDQRGFTEVVLRMRDTGHGMNDATRARIFEPFFTAKGHANGTGLGLATVHGIVEQSGGRIRVESAPGEGAEFQIFLPRAAGVIP